MPHNIGAVHFPQDFFLQEFSHKATPEKSCEVLPKILSLARLSVPLTQDITRILEKSCPTCVNQTASLFLTIPFIVAAHI